MKISIVTTQVPFVRGGAEYLTDSLEHRLVSRGHQVTTVKVPFKWYPTQAIFEHTLSCRLLNLATGDPDLLIALKFPAYLTPAPKRVWLIHQFRQVYDLWGSPLGGLEDTPESRRLRDMITAADTQELRQAESLYAFSRTVADRLRQYNGIEADGVLYAPLDRPELFTPGTTGDYFFYPSRLNASKRQHLAIEAMRHVRSPFRLVIAGKPDTPEYGRELHRLVEGWGLEDRVRFLGWISEEEKARWMRGAFAALYLSYQEDTYGYVTLEAFHCHKPVVTLNDCGGVLEILEHERNGLVADPTPLELAESMESLWSDRDRAGDLGCDAGLTPSRHRINWDCILDHLTA